MARYEWKIEHVPNANPKKFAQSLEEKLNAIEASGYEIGEIQDAPEGRHRGVVIIAKKPRVGLPKSSAVHP